MSTACGVATIKVYQEEGLIENCQKIGQVLGGELERIKRDHRGVGDVRYIGLFSVLEMVEDKASRQPLREAVMGKIKSELLSRGLFTFVNHNLIFVCPPLCINQDELMAGLEIIEGVLDTCQV